LELPTNSPDPRRYARRGPEVLPQGREPSDRRNSGAQSLIALNLLGRYGGRRRQTDPQQTLRPESRLTFALLMPVDGMKPLARGASQRPRLVKPVPSYCGC
jgi:hypothetical protein